MCSGPILNRGWYFLHIASMGHFTAMGNFEFLLWGGVELWTKPTLQPEPSLSFVKFFR